MGTRRKVRERAAFVFSPGDDTPLLVREGDTRRAPPFKAFAWAAIVVLSFSLVLNIVFDEAVRDPVAELDDLLGEQRPSDAFDVVLEEAQSPDARDNRQVKDDLKEARQKVIELRIQVDHKRVQEEIEAVTGSEYFDKLADIAKQRRSSRQNNTNKHE